MNTQTNIRLQVGLSLMLILAVLVSSSGCAPADRTPEISSFSPVRGLVGSEVMIRGRYLGIGTPAVSFGSAPAEEIITRGSHAIVATVPSDAATGRITVATDYGEATSQENFVVQSDNKWTLLAYIDGDNNLERAALDDFEEMASVGSTDSVSIVVQLDRVPYAVLNAQGQGAYDSTLYGDWTGTKRFLVTQGMTPTVGNQIADLGELNMGDPQVLADFVVWGVQNYPAEHYMLVIWNHGGGWRILHEMLGMRARAAEGTGEPDTGVARAVAWDDTDGQDTLYMAEVREALLDGAQRTMVKLGIVGFDACLMGMLEVAYEIHDLANYMVGSEWLEPNDGWPYDSIVGHLTADPYMTPPDLAKQIVVDYTDSYGVQSVTQSALDLSIVNDVCSKASEFVGVATMEWDSLQAARAEAVEFHPWWSQSAWGVDLGDYADEVVDRVSSREIRAAADELGIAVGKCVIAEGHGGQDLGEARGLAIYFPPSKQAFDNDPDHAGYEAGNTFMPVLFVERFGWDEWLQSYYASMD